jgi:hypothetical protein
VTLLPPTRAGWQRFLDLAPKSGESYSTLKEIGLSWWGRKIPQNLLAEAADEVDEAPPSTSVSRTTSPRIQETTVSRSEVFAPTGDVPPIPPPSRSVATPPPSRPDKPYDEARAALKALGLVPKKYAYYLRQAETAIESGKSYLPIVSRARKTAEKDKVDASRASNRASAAPRAASRPRRSLRGPHPRRSGRLDRRHRREHRRDPLARRSDRGGGPGRDRGADRARPVGGVRRRRGA